MCYFCVHGLDYKLPHRKFPCVDNAGSGGIYTCDSKAGLKALRRLREQTWLSQQSILINIGDDISDFAPLLPDFWNLQVGKRSFVELYCVSESTGNKALRGPSQQVVKRGN